MEKYERKTNNGGIIPCDSHSVFVKLTRDDISSCITVTELPKERTKVFFYKSGNINKNSIDKNKVEIVSNIEDADVIVTQKTIHDFTFYKDVRIPNKYAYLTNEIYNLKSFSGEGAYMGMKKSYEKVFDKIFGRIVMRTKDFLRLATKGDEMSWEEFLSIEKLLKTENRKMAVDILRVFGIHENICKLAYLSRYFNYSEIRSLAVIQQIKNVLPNKDSKMSNIDYAIKTYKISKNNNDKRDYIKIISLDIPGLEESARLNGMEF